MTVILSGGGPTVRPCDTRFAPCCNPCRFGVFLVVLYRRTQPSPRGPKIILLTPSLHTSLDAQPPINSFYSDIAPSLDFAFALAPLLTDQSVVKQQDEDLHCPSRPLIGLCRRVFVIRCIPWHKWFSMRLSTSLSCCYRLWRSNISLPNR